LSSRTWIEIRTGSPQRRARAARRRSSAPCLGRGRRRPRHYIGRRRGGTTVVNVAWACIVIYYIPELDVGNGSDRVICRPPRRQFARVACAIAARRGGLVAAQACGAAPTVAGRRFAAARATRRAPVLRPVDSDAGGRSPARRRD